MVWTTRIYGTTETEAKRFAFLYFRVFIFSQVLQMPPINFAIFLSISRRSAEGLKRVGEGADWKAKMKFQRIVSALVIWYEIKKQRLRNGRGRWKWNGRDLEMLDLCISEIQQSEMPVKVPKDALSLQNWEPNLLLSHKEKFREINPRNPSRWNVPRWSLKESGFSAPSPFSSLQSSRRSATIKSIMDSEKKINGKHHTWFPKNENEKVHWTKEH